jgi:hypothetical protein
MMNNNPWEDDSKQHDRDRDPLDCEIDAALGKLAAIEPRSGIEQRILANLRAEQKQASLRPWWRWPALSAISVAVIVAALLLASKFAQPAPNLAAHHVPTVTLPTAGKTTSRAGNLDGATLAATTFRKRPRAAHHRENENASAPKLDVFPSPQPLSEQERILLAYVAQHRQQAVLIARARMAELKEDLAKETDEQNAAPNHQSPNQSMNQQEHESAGDR